MILTFVHKNTLASKELGFKLLGFYFSASVMLFDVSDLKFSQLLRQIKFLMLIDIVTT